MDADDLKLRSLARHAMRRGADFLDILDLMRQAAHLGSTAARQETNRASGHNCYIRPYFDNLKAVEKETIARVMFECGRNATEASKRLGISRVTLYSRLREYGVAGDCPLEGGLTLEAEPPLDCLEP